MAKGETTDLFPELNMDNEDDKAILAAAKAYNRAKRERDEILTTAKEKVDSKAEKLIGLMRGRKLQKFRFNGVRTEIISGRDKVQVREEEEAEDDDGEE